VADCCKIRITIFFVTASSILFTSVAQESDTTYISVTDSAVIATLQDFDAAQQTAVTPSFAPVPKQAVIYSAVLPGLGQIYNRKYWKLPLVYGGFMGFIYAVSWNNKNYSDYADAYISIVHDAQNNIDNPENWDESWQSFVPAGLDPADYILNDSFKSRLKNGMDFYRRYRDLSIILTVGWYLICMADAYVDARLFDFDISDDLSMRLTPVVTPQTPYNSQLYGLSCSIKF